VDGAFAREKVAVDLNESRRPARVGVVSGIWGLLAHPKCLPIRSANPSDVLAHPKC